MKYLSAGCLAVCLHGLQAQTGLTLADAIQQAQAGHPSVITAAERIRAAEAARLQAGFRPNPRLTLQSENTRFWGNPSFSYPNETDNFAFLNQIFEAGGKRPRRLEFTSAVVRTAEAERAVMMREIASRVSLAYWSAASAAGLRDLLRQDLDNFEKVVQYHRDRVREGAMAEVDLMRILLERDRLSVAAQTAEQDANRAMIALFREMGRENVAPVRLADPLAEVREIPPPDIEAVLRLRPEVEAARQHVRMAQSRVGVQRSLAVPDPDLLFGYKRSTGFNTLIGGLQIDIPFRNRNQGGIAAAEAEIRGAEAQLHLIERQIRAELASAWSDYESRRRLLTGTLMPMRDRAAEISRIAQAAYREGATDLLRLLDAERARIDSLVLFYRSLSEYQQSVTTLQIVTGAPL